MYKNINLIACYALIVYPLILLGLAVHYHYSWDVGLFEMLLIAAGYYVSNIAVGIGFHRLWSHDSYKTNKYVEFVLVMLSAGTLQGPVLSWASNHFKHHAYTDTDQDPHTPLKYNNRFQGFMWAHIGWMLIGEGSYKSIDRLTMVKLGKNKLLRWQLQNYWLIAVFMNTAMPAFVGYCCGLDLVSAYAGLLFIGIGRAMQQHATFCVNSLCHFLGTQKYTSGTSGDIWWFAPFLLGENWHNFHHAFPSDYRNGHKWYQFDVHKWIIYSMSLLGLAWDLKVTSEVRIKSKMQTTANDALQIKQDQLDQLSERIELLTEKLQKRLAELELSKKFIQSKIKNSFLAIQDNLVASGEKLSYQLKNFEQFSDKLIHYWVQKVEYLESSIKHLNLEIDKLGV